MPNYLCLDYGARKIGIAANVERIALPILVIPTAEIFRTLPKIISERRIDMIVVGIANHMDGRESEQSIRTREFIKKLASILPKSIKIVEWDERLTTSEARIAMMQMGSTNPREQLDDIAASILLQSYLDSVYR